MCPGVTQRSFESKRKFQVLAVKYPSLWGIKDSANRSIAIFRTAVGGLKTLIKYNQILYR